MRELGGDVRAGTVAVSISFENYHSQVKVLEDSFRKHHNIPFAWARVSQDLDSVVIRINETQEETEFKLPSPLDDMVHLVYNYTESATAVKPFVLRHLLGIGYEQVIYLDPDTFFLESLDLAGIIGDSALTLTPHRLSPVPDDDNFPNYRDFLQSGAYNLGFISVGDNPECLKFLDWWSEMVTLNCVSKPSVGLFTDQKWIDLVPSLFEARINKHPGLNVAYWNLDERLISRGEGGYLVNKESHLIFLHLSGLSEKSPKHELSKHELGRSRHRNAVNLGLEFLLAEYKHKIRSASNSAKFRTEPRLNLKDSIEPAFRQAIRIALIISKEGNKQPKLRELGKKQLEDWFWTPQEAKNGKLFNPAGIALRLRSQPNFESRDFYLEDKNVVKRNRHADRGLFGRQQSVYEPSKPQESEQTSTETLNMVMGYKPGFGVGDLGSSIENSLRLFGLQPEKVELIPGAITREESRHKIVTQNLVSAVNADSIAKVIKNNNVEVRGKHIGVWSWETESLPVWMSEGFGPVDEIWAISEFTAEALRRSAPDIIQVKTVPILHLEKPPKAESSTNLFTFLAIMDLRSVVARKNPFGLIAAFKKAFQRDDSTRLVIKISGGKDHPEIIGQIRSLLPPNASLIDKQLPPFEIERLIRDADCFVSLHRSEGFGMNISKSMNLGTPVISTAYGGNLDYQTPENSLLVDFRKVRVGKGNFPYEESDFWADPDIDQAAELMRWASKNRDSLQAMGRIAQHDISKKYGAKPVLEWLRREW